MNCIICQDKGTYQTNYDPAGVCTTYGPCSCEAGRRVLESDNAILKKLVNERTEEIHRLKRQVEISAEIFKFPLITSGNADAFAYRLETRDVSPFTPVTNGAAAKWLREVAKELRALEEARKL